MLSKQTACNGVIKTYVGGGQLYTEEGPWSSPE